jgi:predicted O-methyltransferase YrrM
VDLAEDLFPHDVMDPDRLDPFPLPLASMPDGWLNPAEMQLLYTLARRGEGPILEVGPWVGRSTVAIAAGIRDGGYRPFDTVDFGVTSSAEFTERFEVGVETLSDDPSVVPSIQTPGGTMAVLIENLRRRELLPYVTSIVRGDLMQVPLRQGYALIFCDAMHDAREIRLHGPLLKERLAPGGWIVCDDLTDDSLLDLARAELHLGRFFRFNQFGIGAKEV